MELYVLDTSVVIKLFRSDETYSEQVQYVIEDYALSLIDIHVPILCWYEVFNYLSREFPPHECMRIFQHLLKRDFYTRDLTESEYKLVAQWVFENRKSKVTSYDVMFHVMAFSDGGIFFTSDKAYFDLMKKKGAICYIADYKSLVSR